MDAGFVVTVVPADTRRCRLVLHLLSHKRDVNYTIPTLVGRGAKGHGPILRALGEHSITDGATSLR